MPKAGALPRCCTLQVFVLAATPAAMAETADLNPFCSDWASQGECKLNAGYMLVECSASCAAITEHLDLGGAQEQGKLAHQLFAELDTGARLGDDPTVQSAEANFSAQPFDQQFHELHTDESRAAETSPSQAVNAAQLSDQKSDALDIEASHPEQLRDAAQPGETNIAEVAVLEEELQLCHKQLAIAEYRDLNEREKHLRLQAKTALKRALAAEAELSKSSALVSKRAEEVAQERMVKSARNLAVLAEDLKAAERQSKMLQDAIFQLKKDASTRESQLNQLKDDALVASNRAEAAEARAKAADARAEAAETRAAEAEAEAAAFQASAQESEARRLAAAETGRPFVEHLSDALPNASRCIDFEATRLLKVQSVDEISISLGQWTSRGALLEAVSLVMEWSWTILHDAVILALEALGADLEALTVANPFLRRALDSSLAASNIPWREAPTWFVPWREAPTWLVVAASETQALGDTIVRALVHHRPAHKFWLPYPTSADVICEAATSCSAAKLHLLQDRLLLVAWLLLLVLTVVQILLVLPRLLIRFVMYIARCACGRLQVWLQK